MTTAIASTALPAYSNDSEPPSYLVEPSRNERRLAMAPLSSGLRLRTFTIDPSETYVRRSRSGGITLALKRQSSNLRILPAYGRRGLIDGEVSLTDPENVVSVKLKLEGNVEVTRDGLADPTSVLSVTQTLWEGNEESKELCPAMLPVNIRLPTTYRELNKTYHMPPSFYVYFPGQVTVSARVSYVMSVQVARRRKLMLKEWVSDQSLTVYFRYIPRSRPTQPLIPRPLTFRSTIKPSPGEWCQIYSIMQTREDSTLTAIDCHLVIPAVKTFAFHDIVPFHVQLSGPTASLRELYPPNLSKNKASYHLNRLVRVYLWRETIMDIRNQKYSRSQEIGEGILTAIPPPPPEDDDDGKVQVLDWEGELKCDPEVESGGFKIGKLLVKDFIVISVKPPNAQTSPLKPHTYAHAISLVTDSFESDEIGGHRL